MEYTRLGNSGLVVSRVAFGCEPLGGTDWGSFDIREVMTAVGAAVDTGINLFDTADVYGLGLSEERLAQALGENRKKVFIASKCGVAWLEKGHTRRAATSLDASARHIYQALDSSLRRLKLDCVPLYFVHWPDPKTPLDETLEALDRCRQAGKLRHIGLSNFPLEMIRKAAAITAITAVELQYNLISREAEAEVLPYCREAGIGVLAYGVLRQGLLSGKYNETASFDSSDRRSRLPHCSPANLARLGETVQRLRDAAAAIGKSAVQLGIRWALENPAVCSAIAGAKSSLQIRESAGAGDWAGLPAARRCLESGQSEDVVPCVSEKVCAF